jgi:hypothetical protein
MQLVPRSPFSVAAELEAVGQALAQVQDHIRQDWAAHAEANQRIAQAAEQLEGVRRLAHQAQTDNVSDSDALKQAYSDEGVLTQRLDRVHGDLAAPHGNWVELLAEVDRVFEEAGRVAAVLRGELEAGQAAIAALTTATGVVGRMNAWRGGFGASIFGSPGAQALDQARALLAAGSYGEALRAAECARRAAQAAMAEAEAEEQRRRRAEQERLEREMRRRQEEERRRQAVWSASVSGHSGFGRSGFGQSGFSSHSGVSHSSFSSGSGVSRSGW